MKAAQIALIVLTCGVLPACGGPPLVYENARLDSRMLCQEGAKRVTLMQRYSFDLPEPYRHAPCGTVTGGFDYEKGRDALSVGTSGTFSYGTTEVTAAALYMRVNSFLDGRADGLLYPRQAFLDDLLARQALPSHSGVKPSSLQWVTVQGYQCLRAYERWEGTAVGILEDKVKYWCWEQESGLQQPFYVHAGQRLPLGSKGYDLDQVFILPFFQSLKINPLPAPLLAKARADLQGFCAHVKSRYDQNLRWGDDYPDKRLTLTHLHYCGYNVPLPDLSAPVPQAKSD
ncbi:MULTISPECIES: hypothetical protein [Pseudomonas]|uniref:Uncharacterized protein n=1 Tax=Pseudomonas protegens TaxID=380021 RepID=A0A9Q6IK22_9PSED|nr:MULTISPECIES: hypothetical protein [Pseudomonas]MBS7557549.1 hypothetical protein [Pseudomonas sp. RC4D1]NMY68322.1 hypothetical protein [Pseudomonas sp. WS 5414]PYC43647.1 hypothetical protein DMX08_00565 [Pseudomonas protegens]UZE35511.1 hypothetical protein LOY69_03070 [Pseudomonas sp. B21-059]